VGILKPWHFQAHQLCQGLIIKLNYEKLYLEKTIKMENDIDEKGRVGTAQNYCRLPEIQD